MAYATKPSVAVVTKRTLKQNIELVIRKEEGKSSISCSQQSAAAVAKVDRFVAGADGYEVAVGEGPAYSGVALSATLNWSDLKRNHNKFYIM